MLKFSLLSKFGLKIAMRLKGEKYEIVPMTLEQVLTLINKTFIIPADTDEEYSSIIKTVKGSILCDTISPSKDGRYELRVFNTTGSCNPQKRKSLWIHDTETNKYYEYNAHSFKKLKKSVNELITSAKAGI